MYERFVMIIIFKHYVFVLFFLSEHVFPPSLSCFESCTHHCVISEMDPLLFRLRYLTGTHTSRVTEVT